MNRTFVASALLAVLSACAKPMDVPLADIPKLASLPEVMQGFETVAGRHWSQAGDSSFNDAEFAALKEDAGKIGALTERAKNFSRGPNFDKHVGTMTSLSAALATASDAKDGAAAGKAIADMKATCKACHAETR